MLLVRALSTLAAGAVTLAGVVATTNPAQAADEPDLPTYSCTFTANVLGIPLAASLDVPVTASVASVPLWDGTTAPAGTVSLSATLDLDALTDIDGIALTSALVQLIGLDGLFGGTVSLDASHPLTVGNVPVTSALTAAPVEFDDLIGDSLMIGVGSLGSFTPRGSGIQNVALPAEFQVLPNATSGSSVGALLPVALAPITCESVTGAPAVVGRVSVAAAGAAWHPLSELLGSGTGKLTVIGPKHARAGRPVAFRVSLKGGSGTVVAKLGRRVVGKAALARGAATVKVRGLHAGRNRIVFTVGAASATAALRVR